MIPFNTPVWTRLSAFLRRARSIVCLSRILLLLVALELITMPVTQGIWTWDKFLHGGQDFELGLLVIITCFCLLLLRVEQNKIYVGTLLLIRARLLLARKCATLKRFIFTLHSGHRPYIPLGTSAASVSLPLLI